MAHNMGALLMTDGTQAVGKIVSGQDIDPDAL
jgi:hypothetical protein